MKIFIDPGHGGTDPGAVNTSIDLKEANINLMVALDLGEMLKGRGYEIKYSRTTNVNVSLESRARMANDWGADYYISIHCNSTANPQANGTETLVYRLGSTAAKLAQSVQTKLVEANGLRDRGVKEQNLAVLRLTRMPAILVELAFISNPKEAALLADGGFRRTCARGITEGVVAFL